MMKLSVFLLMLLMETCSVSTYQNVALRGKATQSNCYEQAFGAASNAIDGNRDPYFPSGSCTLTDESSNPWWRVDLLEPYIVTSVIIVNRADNSEMLLGPQIHIGNSLDNNGATNPVVVTITTIESLYTLTLTDRVEGRYVTVRIPSDGKVLTLCEVEVYGYHARTEDNLAIQGKAAQSSVYGYCPADRAIDGNRSPWWNDGSCSHTNNDVNPWWRLALLAVITSIPAGETAEFKVPNGMDGRYVYIGIPGRQEYLSLCEVEVFGSALD